MPTCDTPRRTAARTQAGTAHNPDGLEGGRSSCTEGDHIGRPRSLYRRTGGAPDGAHASHTAHKEPHPERARLTASDSLGGGTEQTQGGRATARPLSRDRRRGGAPDGAHSARQDTTRAAPRAGTAHSLRQPQRRPNGTQRGRPHRPPSFVDRRTGGAPDGARIAPPRHEKSRTQSGHGSRTPTASEEAQNRRKEGAPVMGAPSVCGSVWVGDWWSC